MNDGEYASVHILTKERILAGSLVISWLCIAYHIGGLVLAVRAFVLFMLPLTFVWLPDLMSRIAGIATKKSLAPDPPVIPAVLRFTGWSVILGVPLAWLVFSRI